MIKESAIIGLYSLSLKEISDERGSILHMLRSDDEDFTEFGECYLSRLNCGSVKAWKWHSVQSQNLAVPVGRVLLVVFDDRIQSPTSGEVVEFEMGLPEAYFRVHIPPGLWYGLKSVGENPAIVVNCADKPHNQKEGKNLPFDDPYIPYQWSK